MLPSEKNVPKSIEISGLSINEIPLTFMVFVEYENSMTFDVATGARL